MDTCPDCGSGSPIYTPGRWTDRQVRDVKTGEQRTVRTYEKPRCVVCAMRRVHEQHRQMKERSGPQYELSASRSRVGTAAYRAAGSPPKVRPVTHGSIDADGQWHGELKYYLARSMRRAGRMTRPDDWVEATPEQVEAWAAWQRQKPTTSR